MSHTTCGLERNLTHVLTLLMKVTHRVNFIESSNPIATLGLAFPMLGNFTGHNHKN
jgi:hypothetical protein